MYCPDPFAETRPEILRALIQRYPLATLVSVGVNGLEANHIPSGRRMPPRISWRLSGAVPKHCALNASG